MHEDVHTVSVIVDSVSMVMTPCLPTCQPTYLAMNAVNMCLRPEMPAVPLGGRSCNLSIIDTHSFSIRAMLLHTVCV